MKINKLGIIEAFYGQTWRNQARLDVLSTLADAGYRYYVYAPKADSKLRSAWQEPWSDEELENLQRLAGHCRQHKLAFGVGLSPVGLTCIDAKQKVYLRNKLSQIETLQPTLGCIFFDDVKSTGASMAKQQLAITDWIAAELSCVDSWTVCPSFYTTDPVLEKVFGERPKDYWDTLGQGLDASIDLFWTGDKVCSDTISLDGLSAITDQFRRPPTLWDNYPVNDGERMSQFLHLSPFSGRTAELANYTHGHYANPMNQAYLSLLPLLTLPMVYQGLDGRELYEKWRFSAIELLGEDLASRLIDELSHFQEVGLKAMDADTKARLQTLFVETRYVGKTLSPIAVGCLNELQRWLAGDYIFDPACLTDG